MIDLSNTKIHISRLVWGVINGREVYSYKVIAKFHDGSEWMQVINDVHDEIQAWKSVRPTIENIVAHKLNKERNK